MMKYLLSGRCKAGCLTAQIHPTTQERRVSVPLPKEMLLKNISSAQSNTRLKQFPSEELPLAIRWNTQKQEPIFF